MILKCRLAGLIRSYFHLSRRKNPLLRKTKVFILLVLVFGQLKIMLSSYYFNACFYSGEQVFKAYVEQTLL